MHIGQPIAISATFTAEPVEESLSFWTKELGMPVSIVFAPYNQVFQQLLHPGSLLSMNSSGINAVLVRLEDWQRSERKETKARASGAAGGTKLESHVRELITALKSAAERNPVPHLVCVCPPSTAVTGDAERRREFDRLECLLATELAGADGIHLIRTSDFDLYPVPEYYDPHGDTMGHVPYTPLFFASLGTLIARRVHALRTAPIKVIVLDCDQTLWKGVCAEDGPTGITVDAPRKSLQEFVVRQHDSGMLVCLCSKNAETDVAQVFDAHPEMPLQREHIVAQRVNWLAKSENIRSLAAQLDLGLESLALIDDNPVECAEVRRNCPEVLCLQLPGNPEEYCDFLNHVWVFDHLRRTDADAGRTRLYRQNLEREQYRGTSQSFEDFLQGLELKIDIVEADPKRLPRIAQLTQRTNQFNFTTIRRSEDELRKLFRTGFRCLAVEVEDRFGDYGLVGAMIFQQKNQALETDTFLLSCRALGRGVEHRMLAALGALAREQGMDFVTARFVPSSRNQPAADFLNSLAAEKCPRGDGFVYRFATNAAEAATSAMAGFSTATTDPPTHAQPIAPSTDAHRGEPSTGRRGAIPRIASELRDPRKILEAVEQSRGWRIRTLETAWIPPTHPVEKRVAEIWKRELGIDRVGIHDRFLELGGHSLLAVRILSRIHGSFGVDLPLKLFFENPTVSGLAVEIGAALQDSGGEPSGIETPRFETAPQDRYQPFPLTEIQQAYWIGRTAVFELGNVSTHIYVEYESVELDLDRYQAAMRTLIDRHDMLRAVILPSGQQQVLREVPPYEVEVFDLRGKDSETVTADLDHRRHEMSHRVLPSDQWPLFEVKASRLSDRRVRIHAGFDALIADAFSLQILLKELHQLYQDPEAVLPPIEPTFRDYVVSEATFRTSAAYAKSRDYWLARLDTLPPAPDLPLARNPATIAHPRFVCMKSRLGMEQWRRLKARAAVAGLTPSGVLLAAFSDVIRLWSKTPRFTLNLTLFNRLPIHPQVNNIVGDFTSVTLLAVDAPDPHSFEIRARTLQQQFWDDLDHRYVSGVDVLREIAKRGDGAPRAVMPVVFTSILANDLPSDDPELLTWMGDVVYGVAQTPQVWLDHIVLEKAGELTFNWNAVEELFPNGLLREMFDGYCRFLQCLADEEGSWRESWRQTCARLVPPAQREMYAHVNETSAPIPAGLLHDGFVLQVARQGDFPAVVTDERTLTYAELFRRSNQVGHMLRRLGARPNTLVAVVMEKGWEQVVAVLGVLASGAAYLPVEAGLPAERLHYLLERGEVSFILTQSKFDAAIAWPEGLRRIRVDGAELDGADDSPLDPVQTPDDLAYVIFTSGSTGVPKGVMIDHRGALNTVVDVNTRFKVGPADRVLALSSLSFDLSVYDVFGTLAAGGTIVLPAATEIRDPARWARLIADHKVTLWNSVPALMDLLVEYLAGLTSAPSCASLRVVMMSGDWIPVNLPAQIRERIGNPQLISMGGATEASIWSILYPIDHVDPRWKSIPYGGPMANQHVYVLNEAMTPCPVWAPGQLYIGGIGVATGYWRDQEKTNNSFVIHPDTGERLYRTGDLGRWLPDGNIEFMGREDFQVKIQGFRVELEEIESALLQHPGIGAAVVMAVGDAHRERRLAAYIVPARKSAPPPVEDLREFVQRKLPPYMVPSAFLVLDGLPLTPNGKIDRKALPLPGDATERPTADGKETHRKNRIGALVAQVMDISLPDPQANLLSLGATSIHMIRIANLIEKELGFRPRMDTFYSHPTVAGLVTAYKQHLEDQGSTAAAAPRGVPAASMPVSFDFDLILDPKERQAFKNGLPGLRPPTAGDRLVELPSPLLDGPLRPAYPRRRSCRRFASTPIPFLHLSRLLGCLQQAHLDGETRYRYGSAGGLYPVQTYLYAKPHRVEGLAAGTYYYHPVEHRLVVLHPGECVDRGLYDPIINAPIFDTAAFAVYLVAQMKAIGPMYGERSLHYATLEAGLMAQLLETEAPDCGIGLCQIGELEFDRIQRLFNLTPTHDLVHSLLGGPVGPETAHGGDSDQGVESVGSRTRETREDREAPHLEPTPCPRNQPGPLSYAQHGLWLMAQTTETPPFHHPIAFRITGPLNLVTLEQSLNEIIRRHEILRATCQLQDGTPVLAIQPPWTLENFVVDLRGFDADRREREIRGLAEEEVRKAFDLSQGPLFRAKLFRTGEIESILVLTLHTFVADGVSHGILLRELSRLYDSYSKGETSPLTVHRLQFADYALWQRKRVENRHVEDQLAFWKQRLKGVAPLPWPVGDGRGPRTFRGQTEPFTLPPELSESIRALSRNEGVTVFALLLAAGHLLLHRITGRNHTVIGTTVSNRSRGELEDLMGYFANHLLLQAAIRPLLSFRDLMRQCHTATAEALANQDLPFERLLEDLAVDPACPRVPRIQVVFVLHDHLAEEDLLLPGLSLAPYPIERGTASFDIYLRMANTGGAMRGSLEYSTEVFDPATIRRIIDRFQALLQEAVANPHLPLESLRVLDKQETDRLVHAWRNAMPQETPARPHAVPTDSSREAAGAPANFERVRQVTSLWQDVLQLDHVAPDENFFELGGRSVHIIQVHSRLENLLHRTIPVVSLFHYPTVRSLCRYLDDRSIAPTSGRNVSDRGTRLQAARERRARSRTEQNTTARTE